MTSELPNAPQPTSERRGPVASWPHTLAVLAALGIWAYFGRLRADHLRAAENVNRIGLYLRTLSFEWALLVFVLLGLWLRKVPFRVVLGERWTSAKAFARDFGLGLLFLFFSLLISVVFVSHGHGSQDPAVRFMLPFTPAEKAVWILLSLTAGICEEAVMRGYLQRQFSAWSRNAAVGIILQALVFGACHAYQGFLRTIPIAMLGVILGVLAYWRKTVRPGMITHSLQDALGVFARR
jgi:CAAX protease family protein